MKKAIIYILIIIIIVLGVVVYMRWNVPEVMPITPPTQPVTTIPVTPVTTPAAPATVSVTGMQEYTDKTFGFSFWYPDTWQVTPPVNPPFGVQTSGGAVVAKLALEPKGQSYPSIMIEEFHSASTSITDTGGAGPIGPVTYYFDTTTHTWMTNGSGDNAFPAKAASISVNSMGGLHLFGGTSRFDTNIIPLSATNFVVINDGGAANATALATTVLATDPSVATPISTAQQIQTIKKEQTSIQP